MRRLSPHLADAALPRARPTNLVLSGGRLWVAYGCGSWGGGVLSVDAAARNPVPVVVATGLYGAPALAVAGNVLAYGERGLSPATVHVYTVGAGGTTTRRGTDEERWPAVARALRDPVREEQRAALVAYLIAREDEYADEEDLYADLLIDVEMAPCMLTSRIKQAISTVQLFVQRAFLNLEDGVELDRDDQRQWEWMKNYRVWEAARKVFLYPENWVEPELRLDKSPLFEQLENTLRQGELDDVTAEKAYTAYLEGLLKVARLEVMGLYHESEEDGEDTVDVLHVVARTSSQPHEYFYRQWVDSREWTPWERIDGDIEGDHVVLAVHDRRLFLLWPTVAQKAEPIPSTDPDDPPGQRDFFEMKLAWIERMNEQWGGRKRSDTFLTVEGRWDRSTNSDEPGYSMGEATIHFRLADADSLTIECRQGVHMALPGAELLGTFVLDSGTGSMSAQAAVQELPVVAPENAFVQRMRHVYLRSFTPGVPSSVAC